MTARTFVERWSPPFLLRLLGRVEASPLGGRLARGAFWSLAGSLVSRCLGLVSVVLVGRIIGRVEFGEFGVIQNTIGMFGVVAGFGMGITANKHVAEFKRNDPARAGRILALSGVTAWITSGLMAAVLYVSAPWVAAQVLAAPHLAPLLQICALLLFLSGINGAQSGALGGFEAFKTIASIGLWTGLLSFPVMLFGAWFWGLTGVVWALVISQGFNCLLNHLAVRRAAAACGIHPALRGSMREAQLFWRFSLPAVLTGIVSNAASWGASILVVHQAGGYADMGVFNAVMRVKSVPDLLLSMLLAPILPVLSEAFARKDVPTFQNALLSSSMLALVIIIPVALLFTAAPDLTLLPFGQEYRGHPEIVQWLMLHSVLTALLYAMGNILISMGSMWLAWIMGLFYAVVHLGTAWLLVPQHGSAGFAASMVIGFAVGNIPCVIVLYRRLPEVMAVLRFGSLVTFCLALFAVCVLSSHALAFLPAVCAGVCAAVVCLLGKYWLYVWPRQRNATPPPLAH